MVKDDSDMIVRMLRYVGVGQLLVHEVVMAHILQGIYKYATLRAKTTKSNERQHRWILD